MNNTQFLISLGKKIIEYRKAKCFTENELRCRCETEKLNIIPIKKAEQT